MLKRILTSILSLSLTAALLTPYAYASNTLVSVSFDDVATNSLPDDMLVSSRGAHVCEYAELDKGLQLFASRTGGTFSIDCAINEPYYVSFDVIQGGVPVAGTLSAVSSGNMKQTLLDFKKTGDVNAWDGNRVGGFGKNKNNYCVRYNPTEKTCDIYVNGKAKFMNYRIKSPHVTTTAALEFMFDSTDGTGYVILDNINVYTGTKYRTDFTRAPYNSAVEAEVDTSTDARVGDKVLVNETFDSGDSLVEAPQANTLSVVTQEDGNNVMMFERLNTTDFHLSASNLRTNSDCVVYEFNVYIIDPMSDFRIMMKDSAAKFDLIGELGPNGEFAFNNGFKKTLKMKQWYRISVIGNFYERTWTYYLDGKASGQPGTMNDAYAMSGATADIFRIHASNINTLTTRAAATDSLKFYVDDVRVYEGDALRDEFTEIQKNIDLTDKRSSLISDKTQAALLAPYKAIHARSGVVVSDGKKTLLSSRPYKDEATGEFFIPVDEAAKALGVESAEVEGSVTKDGVVYAPVTKTLSKLFGSYKYVDAEYNSGLYVIGNGFVAPTNSADMQSLNDYAFYLRPTTQQVHDYYEASPQKGVHPRIQATAADFARVREEVKTNQYKKTWAEHIIKEADALINAEPVKYEVIGGRLLYTSRKVLTRMYTLGMAYQLTGEQKYPDRAYIEMATVSAFSDWHPSHHLDPCEMGAAVAIGYDWMYDAFTDEERHVIEQGMYNNLFYDAWLNFLSTSYAMGMASTATNNHNNVVNGGILVGALSMLDVYPDVCEYLISNATHALDMVMFNFAPEGAWFEGPHYWEYTMQYTTKFIATMESVLNTDMGMSSCEGLSTSADYIIYLQSPLSIFNFADGVYETIYSPEMLWLSDEYHNPSVTQAYLKFTGGKIKDLEDTALALLWYDTSITGESVDLTLDKFYASQDTLTMRNSWDDEEPTFVGFHAGETNLPHSQLDGGSFVFDAYGIRWAKDLGMGDYNSEGYWDNATNGKRWRHYRSRAEAHNTIILNPDDNPDHVVNSYAKMTVVESKPRGTIASVDMTQLLGSDVSKATRGAFFTDNRRSLVIRDELQLTAPSEAHWSMITDATAEVDEANHRITLTQGGKQLYVDYATNGEATVSFGQCKPLSDTSLLEPANESANRLDITVNGSGSLNITVKLTPSVVEGSSVTDYDVPISEWHVPDGELPTYPIIDNCTINGETFPFNGVRTLSYLYLEGSLTGVPTVTATDDRYDIEVVNATSLDDSTKIIVRNKLDPTVYTTYVIAFTKINLPMSFEGKTSIPIINISVSETPQEEHPAPHVLDCDFDTRWSAQGSGQWMLLTLNETTDIENVGMSFYVGDTRSTYFSISVSSDGETFSEVYNGQSCGTTNDVEFFPAKASGVKYIRIDFKGNSTDGVDGWNSPTEVVVTK